MCQKKIATIWISFMILFGLNVIIIEIAPIVTASSTLYVGGVNPGNYSTIQGAVDAALDGDTVFVYSKTYYENVVVNKVLTLIGENKTSTIVNGTGGGDVLYISMDWVNVTGFTFTDAGSIDDGIEINAAENCRIIDNIVTSFGQNGIYLYDCSDITVQNNDVMNTTYAIYLEGSSFNTIRANNITGNWDGIRLTQISLSTFSTNNTIAENIISFNDVNGITFDKSSDNIVSGNVMTHNGISIHGDQKSYFNSHEISLDNLVNGKLVYYYKNIGGINLDGIPVGQVILANCTDSNIKNLDLNDTAVGIQLPYCSNISIIGSKIIDNYRGIYARRSSNIEIWNNNVSYHVNSGLLLPQCSYINITGNTVLSNGGTGIDISLSDDNTISNNMLEGNNYGVHMFAASNNLVHRNFISNSRYGIDVRASMTSDNIFMGNTILNSTEFGIYVNSAVNNYFYHNNIINNMIQAYDDVDNIWDNGYPSGGNYWDDYTGSDGNGDGIGDTPYVIDSNSRDNYPLMTPYKFLNNHTILKQGWNLISIPLIQEEQNLDSVLDSIDGMYDAVQSYHIIDTNDPWKHNRVGKLPKNDLSELNETMGFWIHITQLGDTIFVYNGSQPSENQAITLYNGWNLVGYPSLSNKKRKAGLNNLDFGSDVDAIWTYNATSQKWKEITASDYFEVGRGYWVHSKVTKPWIVPLL
ncbi:MAG: right-handed parallel beta-helix repeat-containing protein [Thermoplasmata archaeon]|nr:MAG: right-handed parallel beta-helix repeat-containing protein [Thermoplasmata archaeon]